MILSSCVFTICPSELLLPPAPSDLTPHSLRPHRAVSPSTLLPGVCPPASLEQKEEVKKVTLKAFADRPPLPSGWVAVPSPGPQLSASIPLGPGPPPGLRACLGPQRPRLPACLPGTPSSWLGPWPPVPAPDRCVVTQCLQFSGQAAVGDAWGPLSGLSEAGGGQLSPVPWGPPLFSTLTWEGSSSTFYPPCCLPGGWRGLGLPFAWADSAGPCDRTFEPRPFSGGGTRSRHPVPITHGSGGGTGGVS